MKRLLCLLSAFVASVVMLMSLHTAPATAGSWSGWSVHSPILAEAAVRNKADDKLAEMGKKIDLNNASVRSFLELRGFYPVLAKKIVGNSPYDKVEDVLEIPGLSDRQKSKIQGNLDKFVATPPDEAFVYGQNNVNNGNYD
ncbi:photosystem II complex extrinsic protein PsbU [Roseofilum casamattae]|uniref:Photosystem II extrinsic protein U n=1 Tax=Roseofilum casamattae BLCC-M143 TaxID=3022442 RepID=A0ABT7BZ24_9CYAN|nr:photosystem II complex extrinsic protein PsbU [Roseofilum casamattae]MDJ1184458.1 photosystem II complex extrinsic protein PsbU [Roseofilum casamattae BLCC-M143]